MVWLLETNARPDRFNGGLVYFLDDAKIFATTYQVTTRCTEEIETELSKIEKWGN